MNILLEQQFGVQHERIIKLCDSVSLEDPRVTKIIQNSQRLFRCRGWMGAANFCETLLAQPSRVCPNTMDTLRHLLHMGMLGDCLGYETYDAAFSETMELVN
jgi:hypothetical protein